MQGFRSETVTLDGVQLHYRIGGDPAGQPVILMHGFLATSYVWRHVAPALAREGMSVLAADMRGYGDSDKPEGTHGYDARALGEECRALATQIGFGGGRPVVLVAHDMGAPPALLWAADHPDEVAALVYLDEPVMLGEVLRGIIAFTPEAMAHGSLWWWILPFAPEVPERLVVGNERAFLTWFYERETARPEAIGADAVAEYLRTFSGRRGVLGALGVYRAAFTTIDQTEPLTRDKVSLPVTAIGGASSLGPMMGSWLEQVATDVEVVQVPDCGHFVPEEAPDAVVEHVLRVAARLDA